MGIRAKIRDDARNGVAFAASQAQAFAVFAFEEHWQRLEQSAQALHLSSPIDRRRFLEEARRTVQAYVGRQGPATEFYIRLQITRGAGAIGLDTTLADHASYVILVQPLKQPLEKWQRNGMRLSVATTLHRLHPATVDPAWKTGNYLNSVLTEGGRYVCGDAKSLMPVWARRQAKSAPATRTSSARAAVPRCTPKAFSLPVVFISRRRLHRSAG